MIERIFKSWKSTTLGILIILVTLTMVFYEVATLTEVGAFWAVALVLIYKKDGSNSQSTKTD